MGLLTTGAALAQAELARQPLLLLMLAIYAADPESPPIDESLGTAELYRRLLDGFALREAAKDLDRLARAGSDGDELADDGGLRGQAEDHLRRLEVAALGMFNRGRQDIGEEDLGKDLEVLDQRLMKRPRPADAGQRIIGEFFFVYAPEARALGEAAASGAGHRPEASPAPRRAYEFLHATFGEYLVARRLVDEVADVAAKAFAGRRGHPQPVDDLLFALLSHQPLAGRKSVLDFAAEICADLTAEDQSRVLKVLEVLLGAHRKGHRLPQYSEYRPVPADQVRQLACYSANLVALRVALGSNRGGVPLATLLGSAGEATELWRSTVMLWRAGLDTQGFQAMLSTVTLAGGQVVMSGDTSHLIPLGNEVSLSAWTEILTARLTGDQPMEDRLRHGAAISDDYVYTFDGDDWLRKMTSSLVPAIAGKNTYVEISDPPPGTRDSDVAVVARLILTYLQTLNRNAPVDRELIRLLCRLPRVFEIDIPTLALIALESPGLADEIPELRACLMESTYGPVIEEAVHSGDAEDSPSEAALAGLAEMMVRRRGVWQDHWDFPAGDRGGE